MPETTSAHTEQPAHKEPFPPFQTETFASQLFWLALTFIALYLIMAKSALPRIAGILEARRLRIDGDLADAEQLKQQSEGALAAYEKALAEARARAQTISNQTHERLAAEADERRKTLEGELNSRMVEAEKAIAATRSTAMTNVRSIAADAAGAIVERLTGLRPAPQAVDGAVNDALKS